MRIFQCLLVVFSILFLSATAFAGAPSFNISNVFLDSDDSFVENVVDLWESANDEDPDSALTFRIISETDRSLVDCEVDNDQYIDCIIDSGSEGESLIVVEVEDTNGETTRDSFAVLVRDDDDYRSNSRCSDIEVRARTISIEEDSEETFSFVINNLSDREFEITDYRVRESSTFIGADDEEVMDYYLDLDEDTEIEFLLKAFNVSRDKEATAYVEIEGEFENGRTCDFDDISESFRVRVEEEDFDNFSSSVCSDIEIDDARIYLDEDDFETVEVTVRNENRRDFDVSFVSVSENSSEFKVSISSRPSEIGGYDEEIIKLRFETEKVSRDENEKITLKISGRFSNGKNCSSTSIREQINVRVENKSGSSDDDDIQIRFDESLLTLNPGESKFVRATIENNDSKRKCVDLDFSLSNSNFFTELGNDNICISARNDRGIDIEIKAYSGAQPGNYTGRLEAGFGSRSSSKTLNIKVLGELPVEASQTFEIISYPNSVSLLPNSTEIFSVTISNSSDSALTNLAVTMENVPQGVFFQPFFKQKLEKGEIFTVNTKIETSEVNPAEINAILKISTDKKTLQRPVRISLSETTQPVESAPISGFVSVVGTVGLGVGLLVILVVIIFVIIYLIKR